MSNDLTSKININALDSLFGNDKESTDKMNDQIVEIPLAELHPFPNHPFKVVDDEKMWENVDSIQKHGVIVPGIVRRRPAGGYEIIAGHRRKRACELAGFETMPVFIRDLTDDEAVIVMVDSNIQREKLLPSEKAKAYKMKYEALKHQGKISDEPGNSLEKIGAETGESRSTVQTYIRLADVNDEIMDMIDDNKISLKQGVNISTLKEEEQKELADIMYDNDIIPSLEQTKEIKQLSKDNEFTLNALKDMLLKDKKEKPAEDVVKEKPRKIVVNNDILKKYVPSEYTDKEIEDLIESLLLAWYMSRK